MNIVSQSQCSYSLESSDEWISYGLAGFSFDLPVFASRSQIPSVCGYEPKLIVLGQLGTVDQVAILPIDM